MISAIVLAGGRGKRMNYHKSKQFIEIRESHVLAIQVANFIHKKLIKDVF